ncbi:ribosome maturation factor RimP [Desulfococcus multivorans]|uniref:Ribosome maturation factor RimP n=1 Tax=Desulfococcus multivorans DSM 2059 TaxID=1121405 RepID=S7TQH7_DESML|nr:ribosome maturation factor RimP [Desulfococcus multivorans]AQV02406.1 ribosome maturation factor [Desulfococcus multivorans]EPR39226.1 Ribosome maturation factor rimP [Desulfococcus multivorans DSM 2059]SJZ58307.1 ribosome maturation factor RimP [Desulfococcus multivorans DSM 2059]
MSGNSKRKALKKAPPQRSAADAPPMSHEKERRIVARVYALGEPLCESEGIELVCVEYQRESRGRILRLYIDKPGGVTLDDCAAVSRQLGDLLDVALEEIGTYSLEVSSPGQHRPLGKLLDFEKYRGNTAEIRTTLPINGKKKFKGVLEGVSDDTISLRTNSDSLAIPYGLIARARLVNYTEKTDVNTRH